MKTLCFTILFALLATQLAFCDSVSFQVGATIPRIIGVNYFPEGYDQNADESTNVVQQLAMRDGQQIMLETRVVK